MTAARYGAVAAPLPDGDVLIAGGYSQLGFLSSAEVFDPSTGTFTALPALDDHRVRGGGAAARR